MNNSGSKTLSLSVSEGMENRADLSKGSDRFTVRELWSQSKDVVDSPELKCLSKDRLAMGDIVSIEAGKD